ncbi:hypothetical protein TSUD_285430 [Trifolium subterraneum]|uniref:Uncharacterized protein n=1 Tax=Trifolium subterraneum TaxID=3900 RepID=A0A2Z6NIQ8_TRISU|nr:hypothetical protein TSUD_285430 [Trifolium subterraneum]
MEEIQTGRSFRNAIMGLRGGGASLDVSQVMKVPVNESLCKELQGSMVGTLTFEKDVRRIQTTLYMEGFQTIFVTYMGGNMALLRSPVEGDVERLMRRKKDSLDYYFSKLKPWNPGLFAINREVWIKVYGIPLHIWGEKLFKMVGAKLGGFLDFDEDTAALGRFDVARLKILTTIWEYIDVVLKVETEGVCFNLWVVEENGRQSLEVTLGGEREDVGSFMILAANSDAGRSGGCSVDGVANSGEDDDSGNDMNVDLSMDKQHGGGLEAIGGRSLQSLEAKRGDLTLTSEKSTNNSFSQKEILVVSPERVESDRCLSSGAKGDDDVGNFEIKESGPIERVVFFDPLPNPTTPGQHDLGLSSGEPIDLGFQGDDFESRYSSISEPEEVFSSHRSKINKNTPKSFKQKSCTKFNPLGGPKFIQLVEVVSGVGSKARRRRMKGQGEQLREVEVCDGEGVPASEGLIGESNCPARRSQQSKNEQAGYRPLR